MSVLLQLHPYKYKAGRNGSFKHSTIVIMWKRGYRRSITGLCL